MFNSLTKYTLMQTILITGGTGLIGQRLSCMLKESDYNVIHLSRKENLTTEFPAYRWDIPNGFIDKTALQKADHIIHLAGANIAGHRWTKKFKKIALDSRVNSLKLLAKELKKLEETEGKELKSFISASAIGYYGNRGDEWLIEKSAPGDKGFLSETTVQWELAADHVVSLGIRVALLRIGIVLSTKDGALPQLMLSFKANTGTWFGNGKQYYSWIHLDDMARMFQYALENEHVRGAYNAVAPNPVTNKDFVKTIAKALNKKSLMFPTPAFAARLAMGEMADIVLHGSRVNSQKIQDAGFKFKHPDLEAALKDLVAGGK